MDEQINITSSYNEAILQIQRLHIMWIETRNFRESNQINKYREVLRSIELELYYDTTILLKDKLKFPNFLIFSNSFHFLELQ